jgi:hypothetical protein
MSLEAAQSRCDTLNMLFKMYEINLVSSYKDSARRPWRLSVSKNKTEKLFTLTTGNGPQIRFFWSGTQMENYAHRLIRLVQSRADAE